MKGFELVLKSKGKKSAITENIQTAIQMTPRFFFYKNSTNILLNNCEVQHSNQEQRGGIGKSLVCISESHFLLAV